jgi:hypothetical protein
LDNTITFYLLRSIEWLNPIIYLAGLIICIWAYKNCRKCGYLILAIYFFIVSADLIFGPTIRRALAERSQNKSQLSAEAEKQYQQEFLALNQKYFPSGRTASYKIGFPLGPIILVAGVWMLAKRDSKKLPD